jgi:hypothetical protein
MSILKTIAIKVKKERVTKKFTQEDLAERGLSQNC